MAVSEQRLTLFALLSEFETDAREQIATYICPDHSVKDDIGAEAFQTLHDRAFKNLLIEEGSEIGLLVFLDIGDAIKILLSNRSLLPSELAASYNRCSKQLGAIPAIRNRVMHQRPLEFDDLPYTTDVLRTLARNSRIFFKRTSAVFKALSEDGLHAAYASMFSYEREPTVLNNLPQADFEDTGFMGRRSQIEELKKAIHGPFPVITVLGVGGAGKSALALHVAYDILNDESSTFDAVIWTSAKTTRLTGTDVQEIVGSISSSVGVAQAALRELGGGDHTDPFTEIKTYLANFRILLFIDNLETILDEKVRAFVRDIPVGSKVVFTSRIGLGAYDFVVPVSNLDTKEASAFFRRVATVWRLSEMAQLPNDAVQAYCKRLNFSPLGIKWFIQAVSTGASAQRLLANPEDLLRFCLENIVDKLSDTAKSLLLSLAITGREQSPASLHYLSDIEPWAVQDGLRELIASHLTSVIVSKFGEEDRYRISTLAQTYIGRFLTPKPALQAETRRRQAQLNAMAERAAAERKVGFNYDPGHIYIRPEFAGTDAVAANYLRRALIAVRNERWEDAFNEISGARHVAPSYFEVFRTEGFAAAASGNVMRAKSAYDEALALKDDYPPLSVQYAGFLMKSLSDGLSAELIILEAIKHDPEAPTLKLELSRCFLYQGKFKEVWETLDSIDRDKLLSTRMERMFWDISIQSCTRYSQRLVEKGASLEAADAIARVQAIVEEMPEYAVDAQIQKNVAKGLTICRRLVASEGQGPASQMARVRATIASICRFLDVPAVGLDEIGAPAATDRRGGKVCHLPADRLFGFLDGDDGQRLFFHRNNFLSKSEFDQLKIGTPLAYAIGYNGQGPCADEIATVQG
jgi:hypothetical protein